MDPSQQFRQFFRTFLSPGRTIRPRPDDPHLAAFDDARRASRETGDGTRPLDAA